MPKFLEGSAYRHGLLAVVKSGTDFILSGGRYHVVKDLGDCMYRAIKRGVCERWLGRVSGFVAKKIVATNASGISCVSYCIILTVRPEDYLRIGILCTYRHFVRALPIFCI